MREVTERPEAVKAGAAKIVGTDPEIIFREACRLLDDPEERARMTAVRNPFGDGRASRRIADFLLGEPNADPFLGG